MSISAMKQALEVIEAAIEAGDWKVDGACDPDMAIHSLRQAIAEAEKQEGWVLREVYFSEGEPISHREPQWVGLRDEELPEGETYDFDRGVRWAEQYLKQKIVPSDYLDSHQQEPVAFRNTETGDFCTGGFLRKDWAKWQPLYTAPVNARPVVHAVRCTYPQCQATNGCVGACSKGQADLASVGEVGVWGHQREWVGLTDEEVHDAFNFVEFIKQISFDRDRPEWCENFAAYIEAKLKEKNS